MSCLPGGNNDKGERIYFLASWPIVIIQIIIYSLIVYNGYKAGEFQSTDNPVLSEIKDEWKILPWKNLVISDTPCDDPFFHNIWRGTEAGCKVFYQGENQLMTRTEYDDLPIRRNVQWPTCHAQEAFE